MSQVLLKVLTGPHGTNKLHLLQGAGRPQVRRAAGAAVLPGCQARRLHIRGRPQGAAAVRSQSLVVYFPGDVITAKSTEPRIKELQDHQHVARMLADKFGAGGVCV